jgi:hypothetical protein
MHIETLKRKVRLYGTKAGFSLKQETALLRRVVTEKGAKLRTYKRLIKAKLIKKKSPRDKVLTLLRKSQKKTSSLY